MNGWQPIETAPKNTDDVLLWVNGIHMIAYWLERGDYGPGWYVSDGHASHFLAAGTPTHWMLPPAPPSA